MTYQTLTYKVQLSFVQITAIANIQQNLLELSATGVQLEKIEKDYRLQTHTHIIEDLGILLSEMYNPEFCFNPMILKLLILKMEIVEKCITDLTTQMAYEYLTTYKNARIVLTTILIDVLSPLEFKP
jgi:hypothetical protein